MSPSSIFPPITRYLLKPLFGSALRTVLFSLFLFSMMIVGLILNNHCYSVTPMDNWEVCGGRLHIMYWGLVGFCSSIKFAISYVEWRRDQRLAQESADERV